MIPHSLLGHDLLGSGVRNRVTACRRRLRVNRVNDRAQVRVQLDELSSPDPHSTSEFPQDFVVMRQSTENPGCSATEIEPAEQPVFPVGTQEVGIT